ncbi:MAG: hypothetical protein L0K86_07070 [Actinomycetia bacterium]|nr:hypothetical protein [Actinomycetes bacterium]
MVIDRAVEHALFYAGMAVLAVWAFQPVRNSHGGDDDTTTKDKPTDPVPDAVSTIEE